MRITPAHAGKSNAVSKNPSVSKDHPRTRGEKFHFLISYQYIFRITPAHAGKRTVLDRELRAIGDHPRTRGEKWGVLKNLRRTKGSPPHTRGKG